MPPTDTATGSHWVCTWCVIFQGVKERDLPNWPAWGDTEAIARHIEEVHHIPVRRPGESHDQALARHRRENPEAGGPNCRCPHCAHNREALKLLGRN